MGEGYRYGVCKLQRQQDDDGSVRTQRVGIHGVDRIARGLHRSEKGGYLGLPREHVAVP